MRTLSSYAIAVFLGFASSGAAWAQQQDLEVTISVVPADAAADAATKVIALPDTASPQAQESSAFGHSVANKAREMRGELGREFGQEVQAAARERAQARGASAQGSGKP